MKIDGAMHEPNVAYYRDGDLFVASLNRGIGGFYKRCGDGMFLFFHGMVFDAEAAARASADVLSRQNVKNGRESGVLGIVYMVKGFEAKTEGNILRPIGYEPESFANCRIEEILRRIEATLSSAGTLDWGTSTPWR